MKSAILFVAALAVYAESHGASLTSEVLVIVLACLAIWAVAAAGRR